jgi:3',5'-cyclic AMP phosphodiesterase CpdA
MIVAQITDFHIGLPGSILHDQTKTHERLAAAVEHLNNLRPTPDVIIATGDLVDVGARGEYELLREMLAPLDAPIYLMPGNHDDREMLREIFPDHDYLGDTGFVQYELAVGDLRVLTLDTHRKGWPSGELCTDRLSWLKSKLDEDPERPTLIAMHHPPFRTGLRAMDQMGLDDAGNLRRLLKNYHNIEAVICGHIHRQIVHRFANTFAMTAPSTSHQIAFDIEDNLNLALAMEPPAVMMHVWQGKGDNLVSHVSFVGDSFKIIPITLGDYTQNRMRERDFT